MKSRVLLQPLQHFGMLVRGVIVDDQMQVQVGRSTGVNLLEKLDPLLMPMPLHAISDDFPFGQFDCGEQCGRAIAFVIVCERRQSAGEQRQSLPRANQGLNLALLIARENDGVLRWILIQPDQIDQFFG